MVRGGFLFKGTTMDDRFSLVGFERQIDAIDETILRLMDSKADLNRRPTPGSWSIAQCIHHLNLTTDAFLTAWRDAERVVLAGQGTESRPYGWFLRRMLWTMEPPYRMKTKTAKGFQPGEVDSGLFTLEAFRERQPLVKDAAREACGYDLTRSRVRSPFVSWMRYPLGFSFDLFAAHERRHLWQAGEIERVSLTG
ncbi:DinB family protein [Edaphobacter aggregans]|uniref:DinB family protein n=1 Tax=Edaphobacter aggregans TaxID=570835 RepID=UPI0005599617|nr:DinB family protein [Edaphobacter aggregans]